MSSRILWSDRAKNDFRNILIYLTETWSSKEVLKFVDKIERDILLLISNPEIGIVSKKKSIRKLVISKQTSLYYKIIRGDIYIITLFDNRQSPEKLKL